MQLTDEKRLGMIAAQQLDAHLEDEDQHFRGGEGRLTLENAVIADIAVMPPPDEESETRRKSVREYWS